MTPALKARLDEIEAAIETRLRLSFAYTDQDGAETHRSVRPLSLWFWGKVWTLVAWCELREDFRMFRIDRIGTCDTAARFRSEPGRRLADFLRRMERDRCR